MSIRSRRRRSRLEGMTEEVPTTSFSDIAFLLIVFFLVATTLTQTFGFRTELPSGEEGERAEEKTPTVQITGDEVKFNGDATSIDRLREQLAELQLPEKDPEARIVMLEAADDVTYEIYYRVMNVIARAGGVVAIVEEEGGEPPG